MFYIAPRSINTVEVCCYLNLLQCQFSVKSSAIRTSAHPHVMCGLDVLNLNLATLLTIMPMPTLSESLHRPSLPSGPNLISDAVPLLRKSIPSTYTGNALRQPTAQPASTVHQYSLKSRGRDFAIVAVNSHAHNAQDRPLLYFGEEIKGFVILSLSDLSKMQSMDVVVSWLVSQL